jgi:hypothetical protein
LSSLLRLVFGVPGCGRLGGALAGVRLPARLVSWIGSWGELVSLRRVAHGQQRSTGDCQHEDDNNDDYKNLQKHSPRAAARRATRPLPVAITLPRAGYPPGPAPNSPDWCSCGPPMPARATGSVKHLLGEVSGRSAPLGAVAPTQSGRPPTVGLDLVRWWLRKGLSCGPCSRSAIRSPRRDEGGMGNGRGDRASDARACDRGRPDP